jgi:hypothetical protein
MRPPTTFSLVLAMLALTSTSSQADPPVRNKDAEFITDFMTAEDGTLDSPDDLLLDVNPCDLDQPDVLEPILAPDGHQLTLGELSGVRGHATIRCDNRGTHVTMRLSGLIPGGVYTIWLLTFEEPGFTPDFAHLIGEGSLGPPDGSRNDFVASARGRAIISVLHPLGALSEFGEVTDCLFDEFEFHLVGAYHPNGQTYGPTPGPTDAPNPFCYFVEHFGFVFQTPPPIPGTCGQDSALQCRGRAEGTACGSPSRPGSCVGAPACRCESTPPPPGTCGQDSALYCIGRPAGAPCRVGRYSGTCLGAPTCHCQLNCPRGGCR